MTNVQQQIKAAKNLNELLETILAIYGETTDLQLTKNQEERIEDQALRGELEQQMNSLPTFEGESPNDTIGI
jgi:hypothetical protein